MDISIIVPNYNGEKLLKENLPFVLTAVENYKNGKVEIIIPDDASSDNSKSVILDFINSIKSKNIIGKKEFNTDRKKGGFSSNVNRGVKLATGEVIILLNSDVKPHDNFLGPLLSHFENPDVFAVGCMDESIENGQTVLRGRGVGKWLRGFLIHGEGTLNKQNTLWVSCGSGAFRRSIWVKLGGLNELYNPFYWEDIDLSYRAQKMGYETLFEVKSVVRHEHSSGSIAKNYKRFSIQKIAYRNMLVFVWVNITDSGYILNHIFWLPVFLFKTLTNKDFAFFSGLVLAAKMLPAIFQIRSKTAKLFTQSDKSVLAKNQD